MHTVELGCLHHDCPWARDDDARRCAMRSQERGSARVEGERRTGGHLL
jgi:hypothetical protein